MDKIEFVFNNKKTTIDFETDNYTPNTTLLQYIRSQDGSKGTKEGCNEGDCGACTVTLVEKINGKLTFRAINSCVMFLPSVHGKQIITIEQIGTENKLHPIQQIFVEQHASQCGFCTPGFIMSLFAQKAQKINSTQEDLVEAIHGNLCRCTGYRPIVVSSEKIAQISDLSRFQNYVAEDKIDSINNKDTITIQKDEYEYYIPFTFAEALRLRKKHPDAVINSGSTDLVLRVTKRKEKIHKIIDITMIPEIKNIEQDTYNFIFGAGTNIEDIYQFSKNNLKPMEEMLSVFGSKQIRNRASIGGNIATASPIGDTLPVLFALEASVIVKNAKNERTIKLSNFITAYRQTALKPDELIYKVIIPKPSNDKKIKSYKISKRTNLDISTVSAGFTLKLNNNKVEEIILAYGGMAAMTKRAINTETHLIGKEWKEANILEAAEILKEEFSPLTDARSSSDSRRIMAKNLLIKFYEDTKLN